MRPRLLTLRRRFEHLERRLLMTSDIHLSSFVGTAIPDGDTTPTITKTTDFGNAGTVGESITRTFAITNFGTTALNLTATPRVQITGVNATEFTVTVQPPSSVSANSNTTFQITFDPTGLGARTATVNISSNDPDEATYDFAIQGTGTTSSVSAAEIDVSSFTGVSIPDGDSSPNTTKTTDFGSTATAGGTLSRTFVISSLGTGPLNLTGTPRVAVSGANAGDFTVAVQPPSVINNGTNATFQVIFDPSANGMRTATLSIASDDSNENPYTFDIKGTGNLGSFNVDIDVSSFTGVSIPNSDSSPNAIKTTDFGTTAITGGQVTRTFVITNFGTQPLQLSGLPTIQLGGPQSFDYSIVSFAPASVAAGTNTTFAVRFDPSGPGTRSATVRINNNDADESPYTFDLIGFGDTMGGTVDIDLSSIGGVPIPTGDITPTLAKTTDFGDSTVGLGSITRTFVITNFGTGNLALTGTPLVSISGTNAADFSVIVLPSSTVSPSTNTSFLVRFAPLTTGVRTAQINILSNDGDENPYTFGIKGNGTL